MTYIQAKAFNERLHTYLRENGYFQKDLASELAMNEKVLSRKLNSNTGNHLTDDDVRRIILILVRWKVITTQDEAVHLLKLAQLDASFFSYEEWHTSPLHRLEGNGTMLTTPPEASSLPAHPVYPPTHADYALSRHLQHNLPALLTRLVGREKAVEQVRQLLEQDDVRLVTLVGSGGSGKTRLALQVAYELTEAFAQGVWFVSLAPVHDTALVPQSIMQTLNIMSLPTMSAMESLIKYLRHKQLLLVLDNFEQVVEAAPIIDELLVAAPGLKVLITSRMVLRLYGEHEFNVLPLDIPDASAGLGAAKLSQFSAIQLFVERVESVMHEFDLTDENAATIAQICARLDGLPLALELAAARVKLFPPAQLLAQLMEARLPILTSKARNLPERQQTLRNTIKWSYDLLSPLEQKWFARLGIFSGGWSLKAVEAMIQALTASKSQHENEHAPISAIDLLEHLMDNSLLVKLPVDRQVRFTLLETLREYALEQLTAQGELAIVSDWHASYYRSVAEAAEVGLRCSEQRKWQECLVAEQDNFRAALEWSCQRAKDGATTEVSATEVSLRLASALRPHWEWQGHFFEGRHWLETALALPIGAEIGKTMLAARAKALSETACLACLQNEQERAVALADESIEIWQQLGNADGLATALFHRGWTAQAVCDNDLAKEVYEKGLDLAYATGNTWLQAQLLMYLGSVAGFQSDFEQMRSYYTQGKALFEQIGDNIAIADLLKDRGSIAILEHKYEEAIAFLIKGIQLSYELGYKQFIATGMGSLGFAVGMRGKPDPISASVQSAQFWGAADSIQSAIGTSPWLSNFPVAREMFLQIYTRIDRASWKMAWRTGRSLTTEQAVEMCLNIARERRLDLGDIMRDVDLPSRKIPGA